MVRAGRTDAAVLRRIARRVEDILEAARERDRHGQTLALDIDARFRLQDLGAVQFQLASAILEEVSGLRQEEVVSELFSLGLATVLRSAAQATSQGRFSDPLVEEPDEFFDGEEGWESLCEVPVVLGAGRVIN